jgi:hypothetical protein
MQRRMIERLETLREGTTICPGRLARDCGSTLKTVRPHLMELAQMGKIVLSQKGRKVNPSSLQGPFRVCRA